MREQRPLVWPDRPDAGREPGTAARLVPSPAAHAATRGDHCRVIVRSLYGPEPERRARHLATQVLADLDAAKRLDDVQLAIYEMATNAHRHAPPPYELRIFVSAAIVKLAVVDGGTDHEMLARRLAQTATAGTPSLEESGRGLLLITALFPGAHGVEPAHAWPGQPGAKQVWISTPLDSCRRQPRHHEY